MKLLTQEIQRRLPRIYETDGVPAEKRKVPLKLFNPCGIGTWYALEYDPDERVFFGLVDLHEKELGYFSLAELESVRVKPFGLGIERDIHWDPNTTLADVQAGRAT